MTPNDQTPEAMTEDEIQGAINDYVQAAKNAIKAGFDGVEIHGANGDLCDQFLKTICNQRTDGFPDSAKHAVDEMYKDYDVIVVFGRYFVTNPDLVYRVKEGLPLAAYDRTVLYTPKEPKGYIDYPSSQQYLRMVAAV